MIFAGDGLGNLPSTWPHTWQSIQVLKGGAVDHVTGRPHLVQGSCSGTSYSNDIHTVNPG